ncbi:MAG TPA: enoyl-CoA hydratase-related protein [Myxococcales bacterium]|nr:enoyl-CoA hydratase-related protein [Myxococcales bacterium]
MSSLLREQRGQVWLLTIDGEAQMNVLSRGLVVELRDTAIAAASDPDVRAVVITGAGDRAFCAGANLKERAGWSDDDVRRWLVELHEGLRAIERCGRPWIAAVNGVALGGGCELALACDLRVVDPAAEMGLPEVRVGILPAGGGTVRLARLIGQSRARDLILTGRRVGALEALQLGLANRVTGPRESVFAALGLAAEIAANAPVAVSAAKASMEEAWDLPLEEALAAERAHYEKPLRTEDRLEGLKAFAEKRVPRWKGR